MNFNNYARQVDGDGSTSPTSSPTGVEGYSSHEDGSLCNCSAAVRCLRCLHIEGLPVSVSAADLSTFMAPYGQVQYAEAAPAALSKPVSTTHCLHGYVVFADHQGACRAKRILQPRWMEQPAADVPRVGFCKPHSLVPLCTPALRSFVTAQWAQTAAAGKSSPEHKKLSCRVNALFICKLHQHVTTARLCSLFGQFGKMLACEVQYHSDGRSAGHGVVIYESLDDAERALSCTNGYRLEGRNMEVTPLRLKKLPSKLEHLKDRIKRQVLPGEVSESEDGTGSMPDCSRRSSTGAACTPSAACAGGVVGMMPHQQQAAAALHSMQLDFVQNVQRQLQQVQHMLLMQRAKAAENATADAAGLAFCSASDLHPAFATDTTPLPDSFSMLGSWGLPSAGAGQHPFKTHRVGVPTGLDLSFIS